MRPRVCRRYTLAITRVKCKVYVHGHKVGLTAGACGSDVHSRKGMAEFVTPQVQVRQQEIVGCVPTQLPFFGRLDAAIIRFGS